MPELPEVETTRRGLEPRVVGQRIRRVVVREPRLRWPVSPTLAGDLGGAVVLGVGRRAKYLLIHTDRGSLIVHLGMSGSLRVLARGSRAGRHDHVDLELDNDSVVRFTDPRRFGSILWSAVDALAHPLLAELGPEPWADEFDGAYLYRVSRGRRCAVKALLMDSHIVAGVGNIYATEALFAAGIRPDRAAGKVSQPRYETLVGEVRGVMARAIDMGGTTLRDFTGAEGTPGYFRQTLNAYGRDGEACPGCGARLRLKRIAQRASVYCPHCQK